LGRSLQPLEPLKAKINVINGLFNEPGLGIGIHPGQTGNLLSGVRLRKGPIARAGITADQLIASRIGADTPHRSLVLACEAPIAGFHENDFSLAYSSHLSWQRSGSPMPMEVSPSRAFDRLFEIDGRSWTGSIIERVKERFAHARRRISSFDVQRVDAYLTSVRDVERRVERARSGPADVRDHARLMCDIIALAFQTDSTRVASLVLARDLSSHRYPFLDIRDDHHSASHDDLSDGYERIARFHISHLAYLAAALDAMPEGDGTVLDNCCLLWLSNMWSGWKHDNMKLPVVTVGGLGGAIETGRSLEYLYAGDDRRRLCSLYLSIIERLGITVDRFGDADTTLDGF
jgi:hypothetical protein